MATTTSAPRTSAPSTIVTEQDGVQYVDLKANAANRQFLKDWAEFKVRKSQVDAEEKRLKAYLDAQTGYKSLERSKGDKIFVRLANVVRLKFTWAERTDTDVDLLMQGFPEAFEATRKKVTYPVTSAV